MGGAASGKRTGKTRRKHDAHVLDGIERLRGLLTGSDGIRSFHTSFIADIPAIIYLAALDEASTTLYISPYVERLIGYSPADYQADPDLWVKLIHPDDRDRVLAAFERTRTAGEPFRQKYRMIAKDGRVVWFLDEAKIIADAASVPICHQGAMLEITEREQALEALGVAVERMAEIQEIINRSPVFVFRWRIAAGWPVEFASENVSRLGYTPEDFISGRVSWTGITHPDDLPRLEAETADFLRRGLTEFHQEYRLLAKSGEARWMSDWTKAVTGPAGEVTHYEGIILDITDRKRTEEALRESEAKYRTIIENTGTAIVIAEEDGRISFANREAELLTGRSRDEMEGARSWLEFVHPEDRPLFLRNEKLRLAGDPAAPPSYQGRIVDRTGRVRDVLVNVATIPGTRRRIGSIQDITSLKRAEEDLRQSRETLKTVLDSVPEVLLMIDRAGRIAFLNKALARRLGLPAEEIVGRNAYDFMPAEVAAERRDWAEQVFATGQPAYHEEIRGPSIAETSLFPVVGEDGRVDRIVIYSHDVTERRRTESERRLLATAVDGAAEGVNVIDLDGTIRYANPAFCRMSGYTADDIVGRNIREIRSGLYEDGFYAVAWEEIRSGRPWTGRMKSRRKDGSIFDVEVTVSPVMDAGGRILQFIGVSRDITVQLALEAQLAQSQRLEAVGTLAGGIAHDFNNILAAVIGNAELALDEASLAGAPRSRVDRILQAGRRGKELVRQILAFSRKRAAERRPLRLAALVEETVDLLKASLPATISIDFVAGAPDVRIDADPVQIQQVLINLATNAAYAMREKGGRLEVRLDTAGAGARAEGAASSGVFAALSVKDSGTGIPDDVLARMFEPFFTTKPPGEGTGMGLAVIYGIVKAHDGFIDVRSDMGKGSSFQVYLPALGPEVSVGPGPAAGPAEGRERLLVVDDDEAIAGVMGELLRRIGYDVTALSDPREALKAFAAAPERFDLAILDQTMPHLTGLALAHEMHDIRADLPILIMTGYSDMLSEEAVVEEGISGILMKPQTRAELSASIRKALDAR